MSNDTRIKYILVADKLYSVEKISFYDFTVSANETDLTINDVAEEEVFNITDFKDFIVKLRNWKGNVIDLMEYMKKRENKS
ncbi:MAG: hypothetical protein IJA32_01775 [Lachnospiraceae bacterium]|nr:hypothetical protein [Lachnospiraceae bacterium]